MIAQGGTEDQAKFLGDSFQQRIVDLELENKAIEEENEKIKAKAGVPPTREKDAKPSDFDTYDQFCPGCTLELKVMRPRRRTSTPISSSANLAPESSRNAVCPGLFAFRGWDMVRRLGPAEQAYLSAASEKRQQLQEDRRAVSLRPRRMSDKPQAINIALDLRGNPHAHGDVVPRAFPTVLGPASKKPYTQGSGRLELANDIVASPLASRVFVNRVWKWHFGTGIVNTADNFGARSATRPPTSRSSTTSPSSSRRTACRSRSSSA